MSSPDVARFQDRPWFLDGLKTCERVEQDRPLLLHVKGLAKGMSKRIAQVKSPGRFDVLGDLLLERNADGGNFLVLDCPLQQAHGLVA